MIPYWIFAVFVLSHVVVFALGALAYHGIRMLAARPLIAPPGQKAMSEARMQAMATQMARKQATAEMFGHLNPWGDPPAKIREQVIPEGDGRPASEEAFAPMAQKK